MKREDNPHEWLRYAENDRRAARALLNDGEHEACAFHCQQAVEKLLKAILVKQTGHRPEHTHSLRALLERLTLVETPQELNALITRINTYYIGTRYPLDVVEADAFVRPLAEAAVRQTDEVFEWFLTRIIFDK